MAEPVLRFDHVWKRFRLGSSSDSLADLLASAWRRCLHGRSKDGKSAAGSSRDFWAISDLDFSIDAGEALGIIGPNGAGKSTALKLVARILRPNRGGVEVNARLASLIEVGAGFHGDLTGRENIFLNGAILGMRRREVLEKFDDIVDFAGLSRFIDTPVKRFSSGMYARLGFSIAAHVNPEILLVDEVLSVGDAVFRLRCEERMRQLVGQGTALVFVTHNLEQMRSICPRAIVLEQGRCQFDGASRDAVACYMRAMCRDFGERPTDVLSDDGKSYQDASVNLRFVDESGGDLMWVRSGDALAVEVTIDSPHPVGEIAVEVAARQTAGDNVLCFNSARDGESFRCRLGENRFRLLLPSIPVAGGRYFWNVRVWDVNNGETVVAAPFRFPLIVDDDGRSTGMMCLEHGWSTPSGFDNERDQSGPVPARA